MKKEDEERKEEKEKKEKKRRIMKVENEGEVMGNSNSLYKPTIK